MSRKRIEYSADGQKVIRCNGDCECHRCCVPYDGEDGPHCDECAPDDKVGCRVHRTRPDSQRNWTGSRVMTANENDPC